MPDILNENREAIAAICRQHQVRTLFVFGSAARSTFGPDTSDLDFQVDLGDYEPTIFRRFMALHAALSKLFHREIDLITVRSTGDDRFLDEVRHTRRAIYAA